MAAAAAVSASRAPAPYAGELPRFSSAAGFLAEDFASLVLAVGGAVLAPETMALYRRRYSPSHSQRDVDNRVSKLMVHGGLLFGADDRLPLVPAELFTLTILVAALTTYKASSPFGQAGKVDCAAVRFFAPHWHAGGGSTGATRADRADAPTRRHARAL